MSDLHLRVRYNNISCSDYDDDVHLCLPLLLTLREIPTLRTWLQLKMSELVSSSYTLPDPVQEIAVIIILIISAVEAKMLEQVKH